MDRRTGVFRLPVDLVRARDPSVTRIMGACSIWRAESMLMYDIVEYMASSHHFREMEEGERAPCYLWVNHDDGSLTAEDMGYIY